MPMQKTGPARVVGVPARSATRRRRRTPAAVRRRRRVAALVSALALVAGLGLTIVLGAAALRDLRPPIEWGPADISGIPAATPVPWDAAQPEHGVDVSFPQCGRVLRDMDAGFAIVGLDGGMPDRPNPCFADQWRFARDQAGAAVYVNTADNGRGDPVQVGRRAARGDLEALATHGIPAGTPIWLDVELPEVWRGSQARHRAVITEHLRVLAEAGHPVGVYSAPSLWAEITGDADLAVPTWLGIGAASRDRAEAACERSSFGGRRPDIVQRIGTGSDGRPLDRNVVCGHADLTGLVLPG
jgi:hypothetical protein